MNTTAIRQDEIRFYVNDDEGSEVFVSLPKREGRPAVIYITDYAGKEPEIISLWTQDIDNLIDALLDCKNELRNRYE